VINLFSSVTLSLYGDPHATDRGRGRLHLWT